MDYQQYLREQELKDEIQSGISWDDYDPEYYGWEKTQIISLGDHYKMEFANELSLATIPHKTRRFR